MHVSAQAFGTCAPREAVRPLWGWEQAKQVLGWARRKVLGLGKLKGGLKPKPKPKPPA
jgi:hypothetical protein